jgi:hypothetical protein
MWSHMLLRPNFGALFINAKEGTVTRTSLAEMGHNQDATELKTDNTTADGIIKHTVQKKRSKNEHEILLGRRQSGTRPIQCWMGTR